MRRSLYCSLLAAVASCHCASAITIVINPNGSLSANAPALSAFQRAANAWANSFSDPITVNIDAGLAVLGAGIIGSTGSNLLAGPYNAIRNAMALDAADEAGNAIVGFLPTAAQFTAFVPVGSQFNGDILLTQANAKALGLVDPVTGLSGDPDATITFSSAFNFDYDNSDGVAAGFVDFETVAAHEIGHALGFISGVDLIDGVAPSTDMYLSTLDLFRFRASLLPTSNALFTTTARSFVPGENASFSDTVSTWAFSTGLTDGDGRQASHWKDDGLTGIHIGQMDPTLSFATISPITAADLRALDVIGYEAVPEPATFALVGAALTIAALYRRRQSR